MVFICSELWGHVPGAVDIEQSHVVILRASLRLRMHLGWSEQATKLCIINLVAKVWVEPLIKRLLALFEGQQVLLGTAWVAQHLLEFLDQQLAILGQESAKLLILFWIFPHAQFCDFETDTAVRSLNASECLLPLVQVQHSVFANVNGVEQVFDHRVGGRLVSSKLVGFYNQLREVSKGDAAIFFEVKLQIWNKRKAPLETNKFKFPASNIWNG